MTVNYSVNTHTLTYTSLTQEASLDNCNFLLSHSNKIFAMTVFCHGYLMLLQVFMSMLYALPTK
jgi:hypothetical protein